MTPQNRKNASLSKTVIPMKSGRLARSVAAGIEASGGEHARELGADLELDLGEGRCEQPVPLGAILLPGRQPRLRELPEPLHVDDNGLVRAGGELVAAQIDGKVEQCVRVVATRTGHRADTERLPRLPVPQQNGRVENRRLHGLRECLFLFLTHFRAQVRDHRVVSSEYASACAHALRSFPAQVGDRHPIGGLGISFVLDTDGRARQADPYP